MAKVTVFVQFLCTTCHQPLTQPGAARTEDDRLYFVGRCDDCDEEMPIELTKVITALYQDSPPKRGN